jgi:hypothetical protein
MAEISKITEYKKNANYITFDEIFFIKVIRRILKLNVYRLAAEKEILGRNSSSKKNFFQVWFSRCECF